MPREEQPVSEPAETSDNAFALSGWLGRPILGVAVVIAGVGFAQFSPAAALADVADHFGELDDADTVAAQAGLSGTVLGGGLAAIRMTSLLSLPLASEADRRGRRSSLLLWATVGLVLTVAAAASPGYWWFVAAFALGRPLLTAASTLGSVLAAEHTSTADRAKAVALMSAAYGFGAGAVAVLRGALGGPGFRVVFAVAGVPLALVLLARRFVTEPERFRRRTAGGGGVPPAPTIGAVPRGWRGRVSVLAVLAFATGLVTGPVNTLLFVYAENVRDLSPTFTGVLVVAAAPVGLLGLVVGRLAADRIGRRPTGAFALVALAGAGVFTYTGATGGLVVGYLLSVLLGAVYGVAAVALTTELFPTSMRATVTGWVVVGGILGATVGLLVVGATSDLLDSFTAAFAVVCVPAALSAPLVVLVPETKGLEPEQVPAPGAWRR